MKKIIPLVLAIICIVLFSGLMWKNESHLKNSQSIYVRLQPVDPRSLIQGDYMVLDYQLYLAPESTAENQSDQIYSGHSHDRYIHNKSSVPVYVELNAERIVIHTYFDRPKATSVSKLILKNPNNLIFAHRIYKLLHYFQLQTRGRFPISSIDFVVV